MGLNINVLIADWSWLGEVPPHRRLKRLRDAWYADETGLWEFGASTVEGDWEWPLGPGSTHFGIYEFRRTAGSYKAHFRAGHQWESVRDYADPPVRTALDTLLAGLIWDGPDGTADHKEPGIFSDDPGVDHGVLVARSPTSVRELAAVWRGVEPRLEELRAPFDEHAAAPGTWCGEFHEFTDLLEDWGRVLAEATRRGWAVVGLSD
ncbi:hypothetical protein OG909_12330 [Streptomyces sp. NBC_01754]|uniref:hypothetical protein n=1 Tax=Streptomyces sp. NBC_01754 TaxID=2975930 RepID=UPI002DD9D869|nr:hypothetical protein [Streptomyces sp. NBC_01754]WSC93021.1 hypothetical protein OG909_12330 [Streptomyces sp. NBC_01754]